MTNRADQEEYLASVAQAIDAGEFDYLRPAEMDTLNTLIAEAWKALEQGEAVETQIDKIEQAIGRK